MRKNKVLTKEGEYNILKQKSEENKIMKRAIIAVMAVIMSLTAVCFAFGCTGTTQNNDNETLRAEIEDLKDRVEDLENKNNVFWTDKAEYSSHYQQHHVGSP